MTFNADSIRDNDRKAYDDDPNGLDQKTVRRVRQIQGPGEVTRVEIGNRGVSKTIPNQISSVNPGLNVLLASYTVPITKRFDLSKVMCSGDNISIYRVYVAGVLCYTKRSTWGNFNIDFYLLEAIVLAGDKIEVFTENKGKGPSDYEAAIIGGESDDD